jgi:hypothetical protein
MLLSHNHARSVIAQNASENEKEKETFPSNYSLRHHHPTTAQSIN